MSILATTPLQPWGILPHGVDDPSVILKTDLTSAATITSPDTGDGGSVVGSPTFHATKGFTNTNGANYPLFTDLTNNADLEIAGQISFEVEKKFIAAKELGGIDHVANAYLFTTSTGTTGGTVTSRWWMNQSTDALITQQFGGDAQNAVDLALDGEDDFVRLTLSWNGSTYDRYINGRPLSIGLINTSPYLTDHFKYIRPGSNVGATDTGLLGYYIRNLQISTRPVMHPTHPTLGNTVVIGHSFATYAKEPNVPVTYSWDMSMGRAIKSYLNERGVGATVTYYATSGAVLDVGLGGTTLDSDFIAAVATRPTAAIIIAGVNDCQSGSWNAANFESGYKGYIDDLAATCEIIVVCTVTTQKSNTTYDTAAIVSNTVEANAIINALPDYNPKVVVSDHFTVCGGEALGSNYFEGERTGALDDIHLSAKGNLVTGLDTGRVVYLAL
jgi:hypothetical protein